MSPFSSSPVLLAVIAFSVVSGYGGFDFGPAEPFPQPVMPTPPVLWCPDNCHEGKVTDAVCCHDNHCEKVKQRDVCDKEATCMWEEGKEGAEGRCKINRDANNNVCCRSKVSPYCEQIAKGECPSNHQVEKECCRVEYHAFKNVLKTAHGKVCCNTPCQEAKYHNCTRHSLCPSEEGLEGRSMEESPPDYGFKKDYLSSPPTYGNVIPYTGFEDSYYHLPTEDQSAVDDVKEITVDDLMGSLVDALSNDKDVYQYASSTYSDPILGKQTYGGLISGFNYPDPNIFIKQIYGSPYGTSQGQFGFYGQGWPQVQGAYPQYGYTAYGQGGNAYGGSSYGQGGNAYGSAKYGQPSYSSGYGQPTSSYSSSYGQPPSSYSSGYGQQSGSYGSGYGQSSSPYASGYGQGANAYWQPPSSYGSSYGQPSSPYGPSYGQQSSPYGTGYGSQSGYSAPQQQSTYGSPPANYAQSTTTTTTSTTYTAPASATTYSAPAPASGTTYARV